MKKIAIIGCGFLGNIIADAMKKGLLADYTLAGAMSHQRLRPRSSARVLVVRRWRASTSCWH